MFWAAARARRRSLWNTSVSTWSFVYACTVVIRPLTMPTVSLRTLAIGARQLVVHEALEITVSLAFSEPWLTP